MTDEKQNNIRRPEDEIRRAPAPLDPAAPKTVQGFRQEFVIVPRLEMPEAPGEKKAPVSTSSDYQPKSRDISKRRKRGMRERNFGVGLAMLICSAAALIPFVFAACGVKADFFPFKFVPETYDVVGGWIDAFRVTAENGWKGEAVKEVWTAMVPEMLLTVGLIGIVVNLFKALTGMFGALRPRRYTLGAGLFLLSICAVFVAALVGAEEIGVARIDFMQDFIYGFATSEFFTLFAVALLNLIAAVVCSLVTPQRTGYTRGK